MTDITHPTPSIEPDLTGTWAVDPHRTTIRFRTKALWVVTVNGTMRVTEGHGTVDTSGHVSGRLIVDANSIDTKNKRRDAHLRDADFLESQKHPTITFDVDHVPLGVGGSSTIEGSLSIHGVTRRIELQAAFQAQRDGFVTVEAHTDIDRSDWGLGWAKMGAQLHNQVTIEATFVRR
jgi:polyisoprenoid-binding protein YceI